MTRWDVTQTTAYLLLSDEDRETLRLVREEAARTRARQHLAAFFGDCGQRSCETCAEAQVTQEIAADESYRAWYEQTEGGTLPLPTGYGD